MEKENIPEKTSFIKDVWKSIAKTEKYPELAAKGVSKAMKYLMLLIVVFALVVNIGNLYNINKEIKGIAKYIDTEIPDFTYNEGILSINTETVVVKETADFGKIIIDTKQEDENKINEYINEVSKENSGVVFLKDKAIIKTGATSATINYNYTDLLAGTEITSFTKQELIDLINSSKMINIYINLYIVLFFYTFVVYFINTLINVLGISLFGYIVSWIVKMKMKYKAIFNMSIYSITLSTILGMIYILVNSFTGFTITFFDVMYVTVASIYLIAAILIMKSEFIKKQGEVIKIVEVEKTVKEDEKTSKEEPEEKPKEEPKEEKKEDKKENKQEQDQDEPEGSNA